MKVLKVRWRGLLVTGLGVFAVSMVVNFRVPVLAELGGDLAMSAAQLGALTSCFALGRLLADLPAGRLVDRQGMRTTFALVGLMVASGSGLFAVSQNRWYAWTAAGLLGIASGVASVAGMTHFSTRSTVTRRGLTMAGFTAALLGGQAFGPLLGGAMAGLGSWRTPMWLGAGLGFAIAIVFGLGHSHGSERGRRARARPPSDPLLEEQRTGPDLSPLSRACLASVPFSLTFAISALPMTVIPIAGAEALGLSSAWIGLALGLGGGLRVVGNFAAGALSDRFSRKVVLVPGLVVQAAGVALLALEGRTWAWLACIVVMSLSSYGVATAGAMLGDRSSRKGAGQRFAAFRVSADFGVLSGGVTTAALYDVGGTALAVLPTVTLLLGSSVIVALFVPETYRRAPAPGALG